MNWSWLVPVVVAFLATIGILINRSYKNPQGRERVKLDLEILELLPQESGVRSQLLKHVETSIRRIITVEDVNRRDPAGMTAGALSVLGSGGLFYGGASNDRWWWWFAAAYVLVGGVVIFCRGFKKRQRDIGGSPVAEAAADAAEKAP
ncbi:hypothetical protein [Streptomyces sp. NBC_01718]|uniref:hypothetical protein n=1 Tax=Streptomyces sp. NBC_01718 TaxID=2975919 RepID=UPI00352F4CF0